MGVKICIWYIIYLQHFKTKTICYIIEILENTEGTIKTGQSRETGNIGYTRDRPKINAREYRSSNKKWTNQRNWQHRVHKKQAENKR